MVLKLLLSLENVILWFNICIVFIFNQLLANPTIHRHLSLYSEKINEFKDDMV